MPYQQSSHYEQFRCVGADCEDTCCEGWQVGIDQPTYDKYQRSSHPVLGPQLQKWIQIQPAGNSVHSYARIALSGSRCPFLAEQLCSIQKELGEDHLSPTCATFPRVITRAGGAVERSLDPACPEAARLALTDPRPASFYEVAGEEQTPESTEKLPGSYWEIRSTILHLLQLRKYSVPQRLTLVGHACDKLDELLEAGEGDPAVRQFLEGFTFGVDAGLYDAHMQNQGADAGAQLALILELMVARIKLDYTAPRYVDLYRELVEGLQLEAGQSMKASGDHYARVYLENYQPFMLQHNYMLEHYLVHYAYRNAFPFGKKTLRERNPLAAQYAVMVTYFAVIRSVSIGLAARHSSEFGTEHVVRSVQSISRTMEHCTAYPARLLEILDAKGMRTASALWLLVQDPSSLAATGRC